MLAEEVDVKDRSGGVDVDGAFNGF